MTTHAYLRLSAKREGDTETLEDQLATCESLAKEKGLKVDRIWREGSGVSARREHRAELEAMLAAIRPGDVVVAWEVSRLTRTGKVAARLRALVDDGLRIVTPQLDTADRSGLMVWALFCELAIQESEDRSVRVTAGKERQRRAGKYMGGQAPWGFKTTKDLGLEPDPETADVAKEVVARFLDGASLRSLCEWLNSEGHTTRLGKPWRHAPLAKWLRQETLAGLVEGERRWDGLISVVEHRQVKEELEARSQKTSSGARTGRRPPTGSVLAGLVSCGSCGSPMVLDRSRGTEGMYSCNGASVGAGCPRRVMANRVLLEDEVALRALRRLAALEPESEELHEVARRWTAVAMPGSATEKAELEEELALVTERMEALSGLFSSGTLDADQLKTLVEPVAARQRELKAELAQAPEELADITPLLDLAQGADDPEASPLQGPWDGLIEERRRDVLSCLVGSVTVRPKERKGPLEPSQVEVSWLS